MIYSDQYETRWHDTDAARRVRPSQLLVYMQETSNHHTASAGMNLDELRDEKQLAFILSRLRLWIHRPLRAFEPIEVQTFTNPAKGLSSLRSFRILRGDEVIAEADSVWALIGTEDRRFHPIEDTGYEFEDEAPLSLPMPPRVRIPSDLPLKNLGSRRIVYSDLDYNMHMNNTRYPDMLCDFLPLEEVSNLRGLSLSYLHEAAYGDTITVLGAKREGCYYIRTVNSEGTICLEAQLWVMPGEEPIS